jgi:hypothetical protein
MCETEAQTYSGIATLVEEQLIIAFSQPGVSLDTVRQATLYNIQPLVNSYVESTCAGASANAFNKRHNYAQRVAQFLISNFETHFTQYAANIFIRTSQGGTGSALSSKAARSYVNRIVKAQL